MFGLPENVVHLLQNYFASKSETIRVYVYGSRAMGREKPGSDVDLAIVSKSDQDLSGTIQAELKELPTPYIFDVVDYGTISHQPLKEHIDRVGKLLFLRAD